MSIIDVISAFAQHQRGIISLKQLDHLGVARSHTRSLVRRDILQRLHNGVYALPGSPPTFARRAHAVLLASPHNAAISHTAALHLHGLVESEPLRVELLRPVGTDQHLRGTTVHRTRQWPYADLVDVAGIRTTSIARTLVDVSAEYTSVGLEYLLDRVIVDRHATPNELHPTFLCFANDPSRRAKLLLNMLAWRSPMPGNTHECVDIELIQAFNRALLPRPAVALAVRLDKMAATLELAYPSHRIAVLREPTARRHVASHTTLHEQLLRNGWICMHATAGTDLDAFAHDVRTELQQRAGIDKVYKPTRPAS